MLSLVLALALTAQADPSGNGHPPPQPASQPASRPAQALQGGGTGADIDGEVTFIFELDEKRFKTQESWSLSNNSNKLVDQLTFKMPRGTSLLRLDEDIQSFAANDPGTAYGTTGPLGPGKHSVSAAYFLRFSGNRTVIRRQLPVNLTSARVIIEDLDGLSIQGNSEVSCETRPLNGLNFKVCSFGGLPAGQVFELRFTGLPSTSTWPRTLTVLICVGFVGWMIVALRQQAVLRTSAATSPISAAARRDQIVRALELLHEDRQADRVSDKKYARRHKELMAQLAAVLREIELAKAER